MKDNRSRYIVFHGSVITLQQGDDGLWLSEDGCIFAYSESANTVDPVIRCGVNPVALPADHPLTDACRAHDFKYTCPAYQLFHTRAEADAELAHAIRLIAGKKWYRVLARPFQLIASWFGGRYWENPRTR